MGKERFGGEMIVWWGCVCVLGVDLVCFSFGKRWTTVPDASALCSERHRRREGAGATLTPVPRGWQSWQCPACVSLCICVSYSCTEKTTLSLPSSCFISVLIASLKVEFSPLCPGWHLCFRFLCLSDKWMCFFGGRPLAHLALFTFLLQWGGVYLSLLLQKDKPGNTNVTSGCPEINRVHV